MPPSVVVPAVAKEKTLGSLTKICAIVVAWRLEMSSRSTTVMNGSLRLVSAEVTRACMVAACADLVPAAAAVVVVKGITAMG